MASKLIVIIAVSVPAVFGMFILGKLLDRSGAAERRRNMNDMIILSCGLLFGLVLLYYGADWLVRGGGAIATRVCVSPLVIGLTLVAFGTSAPELFVSVGVSMSGLGDICVGNVVGSNI